MSEYEDPNVNNEGSNKEKKPQVSSISAEELAAAMGVDVEDYKSGKTNTQKIEIQPIKSQEKSVSEKNRNKETVEIADEIEKIIKQTESSADTEKQNNTKEDQTEDDKELEDVDFDNYFKKILREAEQESNNEQSSVAEDDSSNATQTVTNNEQTNNDVSGEDSETPVTIGEIEINPQSEEKIEPQIEIAEDQSNHQGASVETESISQGETSQGNKSENLVAGQTHDDLVAKEMLAEEQTVTENVQSKNDENSHVSAISAEELAATKAALDNVKVSGEQYSNVTPITEQEIKSAKNTETANNDEEDYLSGENGTLDVPEDMLSSKQDKEDEEKRRRDEEMLSKLDDETRREYEELAKKYLYNPIDENDSTELKTENVGGYDKEFDFSKRTDIKKVSLKGSKKPLIITLIALAIVIAFVSPLVILYFMTRQPVVVLNSLTISEDVVWQYGGDKLDLTNVSLLASYSDGTKKYIYCSYENISEMSANITDEYILPNIDGSVVVYFAHDGKSEKLTINIIKLNAGDISGHVFGNKQLKTNELFDISNILLLREYSASSVQENLPGNFTKTFSASDYELVDFVISDGTYSETQTYSQIKTSGGFVFDAAGTYTITITYGVGTSKITITSFELVVTEVTE